MEKPIKTSLDKHNICPNLTVSLQIDRIRYSIKKESLFSMAARKNKKRDFLFVSKVLGKHVPIHPLVLKIAGSLLCRLWVEEREGYLPPSTDILVKALEKLQIEDIFEGRGFKQRLSLEELEEIEDILNTPIKLKHKTLFIGFAETATGIAHATFSSSLNSYYIHTTRENIDSVKQSLFFKEEHSHATDHAIFALDSDLFNNAEDIVLIDDELTTGNTALNLLNNLPKDKNSGIISILDWRNDEWLKRFHDSSRKILVCSLIKGIIGLEKSGELSFDDTLKTYQLQTSIKEKDIYLSCENLVEGYMKYTGRFGISNEENAVLNENVHKWALELMKVKAEGNCLCLGMGEFIYIPCIISEKLGENVFFHSTTRSPIYAKDEADYSIRNKAALKIGSNFEIDNYIYNIPSNFYNQVFLFSEKPLSKDIKENFKAIFNHFNIKDIVFVSWN